MVDRWIGALLSMLIFSVILMACADQKADFEEDGDFDSDGAESSTDGDSDETDDTADGDEPDGDVEYSDGDADMDSETPVLPVSYVILAADELMESAGRVARYRENTGYGVALHALSDWVSDATDASELETAARENLSAYKEKLAPEAPLFLLLIGDAPDTNSGNISALIPARNCVSNIGDCYTDNRYADLDQDGIPDVAVGRLPFRGNTAVDAYLEKLQRNENTYETGVWNRRIVLYTGEAGFGDTVDGLLETVVMQSLNVMSFSFDILGVYANPSSDYYYTPLEEKVLDLYNGGSILSVYIGHGSPGWTQGLAIEDLDSIDIRHRLPFAFFFACSNGEYRGSEDSIAEAIIRLPNGPVTSMAGSGTTHPYGNAVLPYELQRAVLNERPATIGEAILLSKRYSMDHTDEMRELMDGFAIIAEVPEEEQGTIRLQHLDLYNLFGDPAAKIVFPSSNIRFDKVEGSIESGSLHIQGNAPGLNGGKALVSLETEREVIFNELTPVNPDSPDPATVRENWNLAMDKTITDTEVNLDGESFQADLSWSEDLPRGTYYIKVYAADDLNDSFGSKKAPMQ